MDALGIGNRELARLANVDRNTVATARAGRSNASTYGKLETTLAAFEAETGAAPETAIVTTVELPDGTKVTFQAMTPAEAAQTLAEFLALSAEARAVYRDGS